tara:strand:- start:192 stop:374 length:183 start_codon:yes stop_codon:yes gene_type:complete
MRPGLRSKMNATKDGNSPTVSVMNVGNATMNNKTADAITDKPENALRPLGFLPLAAMSVP